MKDCKYTILSLTPSLLESLFVEVDIEQLISQLQSCRTNGKFTAEEYKIEKMKRWEEIKIKCIFLLSIGIDGSINEDHFINLYRDVTIVLCPCTN